MNAKSFYNSIFSSGFSQGQHIVYLKLILLLITDKSSCNICDVILEGLEKIDDECDVFGIHMVKIQDPQLAKRYSIKTFPAMVYFR